MGLIPLLIDCFPHLLLTDSLCIPLSFLYSFLPYLHNTLCTKTLCSDTCTSHFPIFHRSANYSYPSDIPLFLILSISVVFISTYVRDLHIPPPLLCLSLSNCIISLIFLLFLAFDFHKMLSVCTSAQTLRDTYNSNSCVISYSHS